MTEWIANAASCCMSFTERDLRVAGAYGYSRSEKSQALIAEHRTGCGHNESAAALMGGDLRHHSFARRRCGVRWADHF
jgi:hypothetical protein